MSINTRKVEGRREVRYKSMDDLLEDARRCAVDGSTTIGNWSISQIYQHLTDVLHAGIDGFPPSGFWLLRLIARMFFKNKMLTDGLEPGFKNPRLKPADIPIADALAQFVTAIERFQANPERAPHPWWGAFTSEEAVQFQLRHSELHMSFIVAAEKN
jgi:hypothetical protein